MESERLNFHRQLDANIARLVEAYGGMIQSAKVGDKTRLHLDALQLTSHTISIEQAAESLIGQVRELKLALALQDAEALEADAQHARATLEERYNGSKNHVEELREQLKAAYGSVCKEKPL
uniref:Uncharacterized protein n=1 Tax=Fibrocapsa japonica TaxID=94617 RepID=A0A7S2UVX4_9STRA|mmetsp:Transcript_11358/g.16753  ORF Transcript_11358/g.16753 Transcript_11358/m.16753 type:complete len:121 (+) Transcript_11358:124-486(+)|eukprot:CAMPEP_0113934226 /NCGR_PEP_ID=MMETSP1339-20121228/1572_1 /TAXON_ID=94617 /ORGANISM="Fibrocapsa japonica" /LENGTH=120 /DNA_ID=CAMNT_0000935935 /DNA_START=110 /DNA_END=472 /DNA_ORIENTATION=- /assembly_acc=CAM_ASM_000762